MSIEKLRELMPVPDKAYKQGIPKKWENIEKALGTRLPSDYKAFINSYGYGLICNFLEIYNPFAANKGMEIEWYKAVIGMFEVFTLDALLFPNPNGLLPCGVTDNAGLYIMWKTVDSPDEWTIVLVDNDSRKITYLDCNLSDFILKVLNDEFSDEVLNWADLVPCTQKFRPYENETRPNWLRACWALLRGFLY